MVLLMCVLEILEPEAAEGALFISPRYGTWLRSLDYVALSS